MRSQSDPARSRRQPGRGLAGALFAAAIATGSAHADPLTVQLSDVRQAQFAGYYVALAKGYYTEAALEVTLLPGRAGGDGAALRPTSRAGRPPDIWSAWMPQALAARENGLKLVNFAQIFPHSGLEMVCRKLGLHSPADLRGKTIAVWPDDARIPFDAWMDRLHLAVPTDVTVEASRRTPPEAAVAPLLNQRADCITALNYDQYWQLIAAGIAPADLQIFHYADAGVATLQDGLYATEETLADSAMADRLVRFLRASVRGWSYAVAHQSEAVAMVLNDGVPDSPAEVARQTRMMSAVARLTPSGLQRMGWLEPAAFDRTVQLLLAARPPALSHPPGTAAYTHDIWMRAGKP